MEKELKFRNNRLEIKLQAQSPMIHFQPGTNGATLRASEAKPKLDRFLLKKLQKETGMAVEELKSDKEYEGIFISKEHNALKYKMQIMVSERPVAFPVGLKTGYDIFYGNIGQKEGNLKKAVFSNPIVTIQCFNGKLRTLLEKYLIEFFLVTNFGTMQGKGFGSFAPSWLTARGELDESDIKMIAEYLKEKLGTSKCYCMKFQTQTSRDRSIEGKNNYCIQMFREIKTFYGVLKSGQNSKGHDKSKGHEKSKGYARSYIYEYMHAQKPAIDNEKAWMKQSSLVPIVSDSKNYQANYQDVKNPRYVRAMLGTGSVIQYRENGKVAATVKIESKEFERVSSPLFFKIVGNVVFIAASDIPEELYDQEFTFSSDWKMKKPERKNKNINTPKKEEFDIHNLMDSYVVYYNGRLREKISGMNSYKKVVCISE